MMLEQLNDYDWAEADLIRYGMTDEDRERFGLVLEDSRNAR